MDRTGQPGRFRAQTIVAAGLTGLCVLAVVVASDLVVLAFLCGAPAFLMMLGWGGRDLITPSVRGRQTPDQAARCYLEWLRHGAWSRAFACIKPETLPSEEALPNIEQLRVAPATVSRQTLSGFKRYWRALLRPGNGVMRIPRRIELRKIQSWERDLIHTTAILTVEVYSPLAYLGLLFGILPVMITYLIARKRVRVELDLTLYQHRRQWWVVPGVPRQPAQRPKLPRARVA
ncbi:MAG: hypothetical protein Tsb0020_51880 [Haliangiales bacterium]